ncbi:hypothetical protein AN958_12759, partial [Leucoagaricus sp. SymC.cos]
IQLWHRCMGHLSPSTILSMEQMRLVQGLKIYLPKDYDYLCANCIHGKSHCLPLPSASSSHYEKIELVIMDLTGPINIPIWDGYIYTLIVVEVSS